MTDQPTQADRERALSVARNCLELNVRISDIGAKAVSSALLAIHAENERLRERVANIPFALGGRVPAELSERLVAGILESDDTKTQEPKVTEARAKPVSFIPFCAYESGDEKCAAEAEPGRSFCARHRAALNPETQAETGPSDEVPSAGQLRGIYEDSRGTDHDSGLLAVYQAGRASLAGALEAWRQRALSAEENVQSLVNTQGDDRRALEAEKAAHVCTKAELSMATEQARQWRDTARQARVMPSYEAIYEALRLCPDSGQLMPWQLHRLANAVLRLLAPTQDSPGALEAIYDRVEAEQPCGYGEAPKTSGGSESAVAAEDGAGSSLAQSEPLVTAGASSDPPDPPADDLPHVPVRGRVVATYKRTEEPYVPSVGERAVLVDSPSRADKGRCGEVFTVLGVERPDGFDDVEYYWHCEDSVGEERYFHRDATWRRAQPQGDAKGVLHTECPKCHGDGVVSESVAEDHCRATTIRECDCEDRNVKPQGEATESDAAWLKRTVEELTTARPVEVRPYATSLGYDTFTVVSPGLRDLCFGDRLRRDADDVRASLADHGWPLRRNARPVEPAGDWKCFRCKGSGIIPATGEYMSEPCNECKGEGLRPAKAADPLEALSKRLDELELQARVTRRMLSERSVWLSWESRYETLAETLARIEREERAK